MSHDVSIKRVPDNLENVARAEFHKERKPIIFKISKSPLRYPGGKSKAVSSILPFIPKDITKLCSPFLGGASLELACASKGIIVYGSDLFQPIIDFWTELIENPEKLVDKVQKYYPLSKNKFYNLQKTYPKLQNKLSKAAVFFVLNRSSFSGATLSGGMSPDHPRFTQSSIDRLREFEVYNFHVSNEDFKGSIDKHDDCLLYLDPPYLNGQALYGQRGNMHKDFEHEELHKILKRRDNWILSYNDCDKVREMYKDHNIVNLKWKYGMSNDKSSKEVLILSDDIQLAA